MKKYIFIILFVCLIPSVLAVPKIVPYVNDFANILTPSEITNLNLLLDSIQQNTTYEIAVVTVQNTEGQDRIEYANQIGDQNGVGKKELSNGIVVLWSLDNEHGGAIATGRGSESIINDAKAGRIGRNSLIYFNNQSYYSGFLYIISQIQNEIQLQNNTNSISSNNNSSSDPSILYIFLVIGIFMLVVLIISWFSSSTDDSDGGYSSGSYSGSSSSYSGSSGGSSFGGGSFGGGGAKF